MEIIALNYTNIFNNQKNIIGKNQDHQYSFTKKEVLLLLLNFKNSRGAITLQPHTKKQQQLKINTYLLNMGPYRAYKNTTGIIMIFFCLNKKVIEK